MSPPPCTLSLLLRGCGHGEEGAQSAFCCCPRHALPPAAAAAASLGMSQVRAKLGEEATGLQDAYCQADLLSSAVCYLKATAVTKAGPGTDGYQIVGILSYSHFTLIEMTAQGTERERTEVVGSPETGLDHGPLTNTQAMLILTHYWPNHPGQPVRTRFCLQCWSRLDHPTRVEM